MLLAMATLGCAIGLALLVYRYDMYEREPWYMLLSTAVVGGFAFWFLSYAEDIVVEWLTDGKITILALSVVAGVMEEAFKLLIVLAIWLAVPRHFNDPFDGLIYGAMAGIGFALAESAFYMDLMGEQLTWLEAFGQEAVRVMLHLLLGALTCFGLGLARFRIRGWPFYLFGGIALSMLIHTAWDYYCGLPGLEGETTTDQRTAAVVLMLALLGLFGGCVMIAVKHSGDHHAVNRIRDLWGWPFNLLMRRREDD